MKQTFRWRRWIPGLIAMASLFWLACGGPASVGGACKEDAGCQTGAKCLGGLCTIPECDAAKACAGGKLCKDSRCVGCKADTECPASQICEKEACTAAACSDQNPCAGGKICSKGRCGDCADDAACGEGKICKDKICEIGCRDDKGCKDGKKCDAAKTTCVECLAVADCKDGKVCRQATCQPCAVDSECSQGDLCLAGKCTKGDCRQTSECKDGKICTANVCSACTDDKSCGDGSICEAGKCQVGCRQNTDCRSGQVCDTQTKVCTGCTKNDDCKTGQICKAGTCASCTDDKECATGELCLNGACLKDACRTSQECTGGLVCRNNRCDGCTVDTECAQGSLCLQGKCAAAACRLNKDCADAKVCKANQCVACTQDAECDPSFLCLQDKCTQASCRNNSECPQGLACLQNKCTNCTQASECGAGSLCIGGLCKVGNCLQSSDCQNGQVCKNNTCDKCIDDRECPAGSLCLSDACKANSCRQNSECSNGQVCKANACAVCAVDADCTGAGIFCFSGACKPGCRAKADCQNGLACKSNVCAACTATSDCGTGEVCLQGVCQIGTCTTNADCLCGQACKAGNCTACASDADCTGGSFCGSGVCNPAPFVNGAFRWADGSVASSCTEYRFPPPDAPALKKPMTASGLFWVQPAGAAAPFKVFCEMCADGGGWQLAFVRNSAALTPFPAFCSNETNLTALETKPEDHSTSLTAATGWMNLNTARYAVLRLAAYQNGQRTYQSDSIFRRDLRLPFGQDGYFLYNDRNGYYWCGGKAAYTDGGSGQVNPPPGASADCKGHSSLGSGWDFSKTVNVNEGLTACGGDASTVMSATFGTLTQQMGQPGTAHAIWIKDALPVVAHQGASRLPDGTSAPDCLAYRQGSELVQPATKDGLYWLQPSGVAAPYQAYCSMTLQGGGWTLVLKADGRQATFAYASPLWTNTALHNGTAIDLDLTEAKLPGFLNVPTDQILIGFRDPIVSTNPTRWAVIEKKANSLHDILKGNTYVPFDKGIGRGGWKGLMASGSLQTFCNREGFNNTSPGAPITSEVRIGIHGNNEDNCDSPDSMIGIGGGTFAGNGCGLASISVGNVSGGGCAPDNGDKNTQAFAYVFVRNAKQSLLLDQGAYRWDDGRYPASCKEYKTPPADSFQAPAVAKGPYWIRLPNENPFQVYCDQTTAGGGWTMVHKLSRDVPGDAFALWTGAVLNEGDTTLLNTAHQTKHYHNRLVPSYWNNPRFPMSEARIALYTAEAEVAFFEFATPGTTNVNWFTKANLRRSGPATDILAQSQNIFGIEGETTPASIRRWYINHLYAGCPGDVGWLAVLQGSACAWEAAPQPHLSIVYIHAPTMSNWNDTNLRREADSFVVYVR